MTENVNILLDDIIFRFKNVFQKILKLIFRITLDLHWNTSCIKVFLSGRERKTFPRLPANLSRKFS